MGLDFLRFSMACGEEVPSSEPAVGRSPCSSAASGRPMARAQTKAPPVPLLVRPERATRADAARLPCSSPALSPVAVCFRASDTSPCSNIYSAITRGQRSPGVVAGCKCPMITYARDAPFTLTLVAGIRRRRLGPGRGRPLHTVWFKRARDSFGLLGFVWEIFRGRSTRFTPPLASGTPGRRAASRRRPTATAGRSRRSLSSCRPAGSSARSCSASGDSAASGDGPTGS